MIRRFYLLPLMAATALSLSLGACDDNKEEAAPPAEQTISETTPPPEAPAKPLVVVDARTYPNNGSSPIAIFLTINNQNVTRDKLLGVTTSIGPAGELHETTVDSDGTAQMRKVSSIEISPHSGKVFKPDGYHIMIQRSGKVLQAGETFDITLDFETAADVVVPVKVVAPTEDGTAPMDHSHHEMPAPETPAAEPTAPAATPEPATAPVADEPAAE